jgi:uncharacterized protein with HEPN domain
MQKDPQFLLDMLLSAKIAVEYIAERSQEEWVINLQLQDAVIRRFLIIGEAARRISEETKRNLPEVPWTAINGMRNRLVHEYDDIDLDVIWDTLIKSLPILIKELEKVVSFEE